LAFAIDEFEPVEAQRMLGDEARIELRGSEPPGAEPVAPLPPGFADRGQLMPSIAASWAA
jgi:hypothetical protein